MTVLGRLALGQLAELRAARHRVEHQHASAGLHDRDHRDQHVAVVAAQQGDRVAGLDAAILERLGQLVDLRRELRPGQLAGIVDDRGLVGEALRGGVHARREARAPLGQLQPRAQHLVRQDRLQHADLTEDLQRKSQFSHGFNVTEFGTPSRATPEDRLIYASRRRNSTYAAARSIPTNTPITRPPPTESNGV